MNTELTLDQTRSDDGALTLAASGEIDLSNIGAFTAGLESALRQTGGVLAVDLTKVNYLDSAAINALFLHADQIRIVANRLLDAILTLSGLADLVRVDIVGSPG
ncbi:STAS domain-containing protein [Mycolicibacterium bacteremicum]|uniref:STAS domain-containing protein n=1 Tax=Mycolicibacterium bacteremicum TaxID=564198 RepID=UPI0026EEAA45|nr:STAS domain-containing protein [Mycolicibacterium bacteremicum]